MTAIEKVIAIARAEEGYLEKATNAQLDSKTANAGHNNWTKYGRDLDATNIYNGKKNGYAWCDMFFDWCMMQAFGLAVAMSITNQPAGGCGAGCTYSAKYYRNVGRFHTSAPQAGDQIFFTNDGGANMYHTGLVVGADATRVYTIEGNTSSTEGVVENGGCVREKSYLLSYSKIGGYGRPDYGAVQMATETPQEVTEMTDEQFKTLFDKMRLGLQDNDCGEWSAQARQWAIDTGLLVGNGTAVDGQPNMLWADFLTREQLVMVLFRFAQMMGKA